MRNFSYLHSADPKGTSNLLIFTRGTKFDVRPPRNERASFCELKTIELSVAEKIARRKSRRSKERTVSNFLTELLTRRQAAVADEQTEANLSVNSAAGVKIKKERRNNRRGASERG